MINVIRTALGLIAVGIVLIFVMGANPVQKKERQDLPVIKRMSAFRGNHFPGFAEFRVQDFEFTDMGHIILKGEPYELLLNVNYITTVQRYEDAKKTDYSTLVYTNYTDAAFLLRQGYDDVVTSIRKAAEAQVK
tara:strand:- start:114 stop:515 length:402 start_codon:yes stop_codon:yes gene_type:complete